MERNAVIKLAVASEATKGNGGAVIDHVDGQNLLGIVAD